MKEIGPIIRKLGMFKIWDHFIISRSMRISIWDSSTSKFAKKMLIKFVGQIWCFYHKMHDRFTLEMLRYAASLLVWYHESDERKHKWELRYATVLYCQQWARELEPQQQFSDSQKGIPRKLNTPRKKISGGVLILK